MFSSLIAPDVSLRGGSRRPVWPLAALLLAMALIAGCTQDPAVQKQKHLDRGLGFLKDSKYNEAMIEFRNAIQVDANFVDAHVGLARAYRRKGWVIDARNEYDKAVQARPKAEEIRAELGQVQLELSLAADAETNAREILKENPRSPRGQTLLGHALVRENRLDEAVRAFQTALDIDPWFADAYVGRATILLVQRKADEAEKEYAQALALDGGNLEAQLGRGRLFAQSRRYPEAEAELQKVLKADPDHRAARLSLALVYSRQNRVDDAIKTLEASK